MNAEQERPWPADRWPTADEWTDWFLGADRDEQIRTATRVLEHSQTAVACFERDHAGLAEECEWLRGKVNRVWALMADATRSAGGPFVAKVDVLVLRRALLGDAQ